MSSGASSSPRASVSAVAPLLLGSPPSRPEGAPISGDVARGGTATDARLEQERDELLAENSALRARLELLSSLTRAAWWDWDVKTERLTAHGDLVEVVQLELPADLGAGGLGRWLGLLHPEDVRRARSAFTRSVSEPGEIAACPLRVRARGGGYRWVLVALTASVDSPRDHALRVFGAARDIHVEKATQETARRNAQVLGAMQVGVVCADMDGTVRYVNAAAERLLGPTVACVGRPLFELFPEPHRAELVELASIAAEGGAPRLMLDRAGGGDAGRSLWLELSSYGDASGKAAGLVCVLGNDTEHPASAVSS